MRALSRNAANAVMGPALRAQAPRGRDEAELRRGDVGR